MVFLLIPVLLLKMLLWPILLKMVPRLLDLAPWLLELLLQGMELRLQLLRQRLELELGKSVKIQIIGIGKLEKKFT